MQGNVQLDVQIIKNLQFAMFCKHFCIKIANRSKVMFVRNPNEWVSISPAENWKLTEIREMKVASTTSVLFLSYMQSRR